MLLLSTHRVESHLFRADFQRLVDEAGKRGRLLGEVAHYVHTDGSGGSLLSEVNDIGPRYESLLTYTEHMEFDVAPVLKIDDAVGPLLSDVGDG